MILSKKHDVTLKDVVNYILRPRNVLQNDNGDNMQSASLIAGAAASGFVVGFAAAILFTPESGAELRQDLSNIFHDTNEKLVQLISENISNLI